MNDATFRRALKTTAKIALSLTVFACGGTVDVADQSSASSSCCPAGSSRCGWISSTTTSTASPSTMATPAATGFGSTHSM